MTILNLGSYILPPTVYAITIDESVTDPSLAVTYPTIAFGQKTVNAGFTPAKNTNGVFTFGDWSGCDLLKGVKRMTATRSGSGSTEKFTFTEHEMTDTITLSGYITTRFPTYWLKSEKVGTKITIALSPSQVDSTWTDYAGTDYNGKRVGHFDLAEYVSGGESRDSNGAFLLSNGQYLATVTPGTYIYPYINTRSHPKIRCQMFTQRQYVDILCMMMFKTTSLNDICGYATAATAWNGSVNALLPATFDNEYGFRGNPDDHTVSSMVFGLSRWNDNWMPVTGSPCGGVVMVGVSWNSITSVSVNPYDTGPDETITVSYKGTTLQKVTKMYGTGAYPLLPVETEDYTGNTTVPNGWGSTMNYATKEMISSNTGTIPPGCGFSYAARSGFVRTSLY